MNSLVVSRDRERLAISNTVAISIVLVFVIIGAGIAAAVMLFGSNPSTSTSSLTTTTSSPTTTSQTNVTIFGLVGTTGTGTHATAMVFVSLRTGQIFVAPTSGNRFSVGLPNQDTYNASMRWAGNYSWQAGEVFTGKLSINMSESSMMAQSYNLVETTPNSVVAVSGSVAWQVASSHPISIKFTANDGQEFFAAVSPDKRTFSANLPNMMTYEVNIGAQNATGGIEWYYAHQLEVSAPVRVVGLIVDISL